MNVISVLIVADDPLARAGLAALLAAEAGIAVAGQSSSDADLGAYLAECIDNPALHDRILPIGGPGPALTPREQGEMLFSLLGRAPRFSQAPFAMMDAIVWTLSGLGVLVPSLRDKAELARIGRYYARESMLLLNPETGLYDADATPSTGAETLYDHYARLIAGEIAHERGEHSVF